MIKVFMIGWIILLTAILLNGLIAKWGLIGWYDFINLLIQKGSQALSTLRVADYVWLFFAYPMLLGMSYKAGEWLYGWLVESTR
jgi:hypothetical protein